MKLLKSTILGAAGMAVCALSQAAVLNFHYQALSSNQFQAVSGDFGVAMNIGDTANLTLTTLPGFDFQAVNSDLMWAILGFEEGGVRSGEYTYSFFDDGALVASNNKTENTSYIHMGPIIEGTGFAGTFDTYMWSGVLTASEASTNTTMDIMYGVYGYGFTSATLVPDPGAVPEPTSLALVCAALLGLGAATRKRSAK